MAASVFPVPLSGIQETKLTTTGDTLYASAANTAARLGIGSTGQVLTVASGLPSWSTLSSGGMTSLATGTLSGATPSISSISGSYKHLELWVTDPYGSGANIINLRFNNDSGGNYGRQLIYSGYPGSPVAGNDSVANISTYNGIITSSNQNSYFYLKIPFYSTTASAKTFQWYWNRTGGSGANEQIWGSYNSSSAISSIQFFLDGGSTFTGGEYTLYGVN